MAGLSSGFSATMASVVSSNPATDAAFCNAVRTTLVGSTIPAFIRSSNSSLAALNPKAPLLFLILSSTIDPSHPALLAIHRHGSSIARRTMFTPTFSSSLTFTVSKTVEVEEGAGLVMLNVPHLKVRREAGIVTRRGGWLSPAAARVIDHLAAICAADPQN